MTRRSLLGYAAAGLLLYLFFLTITLPAVWLDRVVSYASGGTAGLRQTTGTAWHGSGTLVITRRSAPQHALSAQWTVLPWWMLVGRLHLRLQADAPDMQATGTIVLRYQHASLRDFTARADAAVIEQFYAPAALLKPRGMVHLQTSGLDISRSDARGDATVRWENAGVALLGNTPVGDYQAKLLAEGSNGKITVTTLRGDLAVNATGNWRLGTPATVSLKGTAGNPQGRAELATALRALGKADADGRHAFQFSVPLRF